MFRQGQGSHVFHVHGPQEAEAHIKQYVTAMYELNALSTGYDPYNDLYQYHGLSGASSLRMQFKKHQVYEVDVVECDHTVPSVSYCFSEVRRKLKDEYTGTRRCSLSCAFLR